MKIYYKNIEKTVEVYNFTFNEEHIAVLYELPDGGIAYRVYGSFEDLIEEWDLGRILNENEPETTGDCWMAHPHKTLKLNCGLEIALDDYWEIDENGDEKDVFTFDEAKKIEKKIGGEWRVPKMSEWAAICDEIGDEDVCNTINRDTIVDTLGLTANEYGYGCYWSGTVYSPSYGHCLNFNSRSVYPAYRYNRDNRFSVRLVRKVA